MGGGARRPHQADGGPAGGASGGQRLSRVRTSVCAVRDAEDVTACVEGGADAVGVLVGVRHRAEDAVGPEAANELLRLVPPPVGRYVVTHLADLEALSELARLPVDTLQVHDEVSPDVLRLLRTRFPALRLLKALHIGDRIPDWTPFAGLVEGFVLDSVDPEQDRIGGTGRTHDWELSAGVADRCPRPVVLAGGLRPENVAGAIERVRPWAVNVNTGVETGGRKDRAKVQAFVEAARSVLFKPSFGR